MARKKEYSIADGCAKKRPAPPSYSSMENKGKVDCKAAKKAVKRKESNGTAGPSCSDVYDVADLRAQLGSIGLTLRDIPGDGNCLFRALGDQIEGHSRNHMKHRMDTVRYMIAHRKHFEPFIDVPFERYIDNLSRPGTYAGQDALVAFARLHQVNIVIHQLNSPLWQIEGSEIENARELHLSYHNGEHYSSVRHSGDVENTPAHVRIVSLTRADERPCCVSLGKSCDTAVENISSDTEMKPQHSASYNTHPVIEVAPLAIPEAVTDENTYTSNEDDFTALVNEVMLRSNCLDRTLATEAFIDNECDVVQTVDYLISLSVIWETQKNKTEDSNDARPEPKRLIKSDPLINDLTDIASSGTQSTRARRQSTCVSKARGKPEDVILSSDLRFLTL